MCHSEMVFFAFPFFRALDESFWEKILGSWENNVYLQLNTENKLLLILN